MAREPQARRQQASAGDDFYEEEIEGQDDRRQDRNQGDDQDADASLENDAEQEAGDEEDLGAEGDDFFEAELPRQTRGGQRIQALANENREFRRQLEELRRSPQTTVPTGPREETDAEFEARLANLAAEERMEERYKRDRAFQARRDAARDFQTANEADRNKFEVEAQKNRFAAKLRDRVETEFQDRMRRGQPVSRMDLYFWLRGQMVDKTSVKDTETARQHARERVNRHTVPVGRGGGSDVEASRGGRRRPLSEAEARARRLENQQI